MLGLFLCTAHGCAPPPPRVASAAELQQLGTKVYPGRNRDEVLAASETALKLLGYQIITTDPTIRTAPKPVATTGVASYTDYSGVSQTFTETVAWEISVEEAAAGTTLHARARAAVNGQPMEQVFHTWATSNYGTLMHEVDASFGSK